MFVCRFWQIEVVEIDFSYSKLLKWSQNFIEKSLRTAPTRYCLLLKANDRIITSFLSLLQFPLIFLERVQC